MPAKRSPPASAGLLTPKLTKTIAGTSRGAPAVSRRDKNRVVTCTVPHNALVQVFDYKTQKSRIFKGPDLVMLMPDEEFTVVSLSGGMPKRPDALKSLCMHLGPDYMRDELVIETLDHARLQLAVSYNWEFDPSVAVEQGRAFSVPDFVGDACKAIASRIRGFVSSETFDSFHRNSSNIIKLAVFGQNKETGALNPTMHFAVNGLVITNVDIHSVDPVDPKTRDALTKSVQLAIEITTKSQEAVAIQQATTLEQEAKGKLERQIIHAKSGSEMERRQLLSVEADNAAIESTGASKAQAAAVAEATLIEGQSEVDLAEKRSAAMDTNVEAELQVEAAKQSAELDFRQALYELEVAKARELSRIETDKFRKTIAAVGKDTIKAIAKAGPELQAKLLAGLGLQGYLVTDGSNPINLFPVQHREGHDRCCYWWLSIKKGNDTSVVCFARDQYPTHGWVQHTGGFNTRVGSTHGFNIQHGWVQYRTMNQTRRSVERKGEKKNHNLKTTTKISNDILQVSRSNQSGGCRD
ncbi:Hypothetical protein, putative [Bodo saltans]|uniref:Major vault protein n=1 Tax=Bodo saltans TaxID=75058 RepID=A0A0S4ITY6_BODSA|nr:Hypothetical protein, putative [Bodo saltans]|eukprot:CUG07493.1 Hypothetical protein, putative [Bodo saltans]